MSIDYAAAARLLTALADLADNVAPEKRAAHLAAPARKLAKEFRRLAEETPTPDSGRSNCSKAAD